MTAARIPDRVAIKPRKYPPMALHPNRTANTSPDSSLGSRPTASRVNSDRFEMPPRVHHQSAYADPKPAQLAVVEELLRASGQIWHEPGLAAPRQQAEAQIVCWTQPLRRRTRAPIGIDKRKIERVAQPPRAQQILSAERSGYGRNRPRRVGLLECKRPALQASFRDEDSAP